MMTRRPVGLVAVAVLALSAEAARAHHAFSAEFDDSRTISVQGVVTEFHLVNPHATMFMEVRDEAGKIAKWEVEFAGRLNLAKGGWTPTTIKPGERVTVTGNPTHSGSPRLAFLRLVRADGTELVRPGDKVLDTIEEQRRERARQRNQQP
jgi:hypothetical protein